MKNTLNKLKVGEEAIVKKINSAPNIHRRLLDIGLIKNTKIECVLISPAGDPKAYKIRGAIIAIRNEDAEGIIIEM